MKYIKKFEKINNDIEIGDYVILNCDLYSQVLNDFLNSNLGIVDWISDSKKWITLYYNINDIPEILKKFFDDDKFEYSIYIGNVLAYSESKDELELKLKEIKYNL